LGDFLPHIFDPIYEGLRLTAPTSVSAETSPVTAEMAPQWSVLQLEFPARVDQPAVTLHWHDGGKKPDSKSTGFERFPPHGALVIGDKGKLFIPDMGRKPTAMALEADEVLALPEALPPPEQTHWQEWTSACKTGKPTSSSFDYGAGLSDVALIGNIAIRVGRKIAWDAQNRRVSNIDEANRFLTCEYRRGWAPQTFW
jgi:hypothetical protein